MRGTLADIGLATALAPLNIFENVAGEEPLLMAGGSWQELEFEVGLDSGAVVHICSLEGCPVYALHESPGSRAGQQFLMGEGGTVKNLGQKTLNLSDASVDRDPSSIFQIAAVTRPLVSMGKICDEGHNTTFFAVHAVVREAGGAEICRSHRTPGGLYLTKMKLRNPAAFARPE